MTHGSPRRIGLFTYGEPPEKFMPPRRTRAMLAEAAFQGAELLLFSTADCDPDNGAIVARRWWNGGMETVRVPLPPLVAIVSNPIRDEHHRLGDWIRANAETIDDRGPDKLGQVAALKASALAAHAIPAERVDPMRVEAQVAEWIDRYGGVVVKPVDGMRGGSVHFLIPTAGDDWSLRSGGVTTTGRRPDMIAALRARVAGRLRYRDFMIQRFIRSAFAGLALTVRVDVAKAPAGGWTMYRRVARLGVTGALSTNTATGSAQMFLERFLKFAGRDPAIADAAQTLAVAAADLIDRQPGASIIEAGVDLALDPEDRLHVVEVNVHPESNWSEQDRAAHIIAYLVSRVDHALGPRPRPDAVEEARE